MSAFLLPAPLINRPSKFFPPTCPQAGHYHHLVSPTMSAVSPTPETRTPKTPSPCTSKTTADHDPPLSLPDPFPSPPPLSALGHTMLFTPTPFNRRLASKLRLIRQLRGRLSGSTILTARIAGALSETLPPPPLPFSGPPDLSLPALIDALRLAASDPRIVHLHLRIDGISCGWGKVFEIRRHLDYFRSSGKGITVFMEGGGPKEFFLAAGFALYLPPEGALGLRGFAASGSFVRGVLDNIGVAPQVERIGKYKSAGDTLSRRDMAPAQREVIQSLLGDIHSIWTECICEATGLSKQELADFVNRSPWEMKEYVDVGLVTGICYESDVEDALKLRYSKKGHFESEEDVIRRELSSVDVLRYVRRTSEKLLGIGGRKRIAVIRAVGAITSGKNSSNPAMGSTLGSDSLVELIRKVRDDKRYVACLLRCDSPGGSALASDIIWSELRKLGKVKPLLTSQSDVAASGGYYLSMASEIIAEPLTITGSIGVVVAKPSLGELYKKIGYSKETLSVGSKYAELLVDDRPFSEEEAEYFREGAEQAYRKFVSKAAESRGKTYEEMEDVAQGRVWTGLQAKQQGLVDYIGGVRRAVEILKEKAGLEKDTYVKLEEMRVSSSIVERLGLTGARAIESSKGLWTPMLQQPLALLDMDASFQGISPLTRWLFMAAFGHVWGGLELTNTRVAQVVKDVIGNLMHDA